MAKPSGSTSIAVHETEREPFYRRLFARSGFGFAALDSEGRILDANGTFLRAFGVSSPSRLPPFPDCVSPRDRAVITFAMRPSLAEQTPWEIRLQRPDGAEFWVLASFVEAPVLPGEPLAPALIVQTTDIDERKRNALELAERESRWNHALESAGQGVWDHDFARGDLFYSRQWRAIRGLRPDEPIDASLEGWLQCVHPDDRAHVLEEIHKQETGETPFNMFSYRERHKNGHWVWIESRGAVVDYGADGKPTRIAGTDTDITERKEAEERLAQMSRRLELALGVSRIGVFDVNLQTGEVRWDDRMIEMYGVTEKPDAGTWERTLHPQDQSKAKAKVNDNLTRSQDFANEFRIIRGDGEIRHIRSRAAPYVDIAGAPRLIGVNWDVTDDMRLQEELQHAKDLAEARNAELEAARARIEYTALHDHLTGLPNRRYLDTTIEAAARQAQQTGSRLAVLHIDLDRFKEINDTLGHLAGDQMLVHAAGVLNELKGPDDFVARIGGDEFVFLSAGSGGRNLATCSPKRSSTPMRKPVTFNGHICRFGASVGIASLSGAAIDAKQLLVNADLALYRAKNRGRSRHEFFTSDFQAQISVNKQTADEILTGIEQQPLPALLPAAVLRPHARRRRGGDARPLGPPGARHPHARHLPEDRRGSSTAWRRSTGSCWRRRLRDSRPTGSACGLGIAKDLGQRLVEAPARPGTRPLAAHARHPPEVALLRAPGIDLPRRLRPHRAGEPRRDAQARHRHRDRRFRHRPRLHRQPDEALGRGA
jgi:diguanylate cyclase (GGDEF)-like protein/PAS domain S-box-containing protein